MNATAPAHPGKCFGIATQCSIFFLFSLLLTHNYQLDEDINLFYFHFSKFLFPANFAAHERCSHTSPSRDHATASSTPTVLARAFALLLTPRNLWVRHPQPMSLGKVHRTGPPQVPQYKNPCKKIKILNPSKFGKFKTYFLKLHFKTSRQSSALES